MNEYASKMKITELVKKISCLIIAILAWVSFVSSVSEAEALNLSVRIADQYIEVSGSDRLYFEIEVKWPENTRRQDLRIEYQIVEHGADGKEKVIASERVLRAVETQMSYLDYVIVPKDAKSGTKTLNVVIRDYKDLHEEVSATFKVLKGTNKIEIYFYILLAAILLVVILVVIQIKITRKRV